ncbi:unnamed protein product [Clonostachys rosea]|uniref:Xylanolytic transcriptional activator regulatory domain-containing protein n=1 Tax=Bionectria ochroleuca TaxID=29856 RepID=A0ABY6UH71_BIOOC|nr:unnamed protein product [Clonostachys rosea]
MERRPDAVKRPVRIHGNSTVVILADVYDQACRRMRSKCVHDHNNPHCRACKQAGVSPRDCVYPVRGQPDNDREYRHPRIRASKPKPSERRKSGVKASAKQASQNLVTNAELAEYWDLPPIDELVEAVSRFCSHSIQLSFISKDEFCSRLRDDPESVSSFLLASILAISARVSPLAVERYKSGSKASLLCLERASAMSLDQIHQEPTLERCQAFCLLSIAQHCQGFQKESYINLGIAIRMASWLQLHQEEMFELDDASPSMIRRAESARRTLWMLFCHENLVSGSTSVMFLSPPDITTYLPCSEPDFNQGQEPRSRATLAGTPPAIEHPASTEDPGRSLFASLIQVHHIWGIVRRTVSNRHSGPDDSDNDLAELKTKLKHWEDSLPKYHAWSLPMLRKHRANGHELAYLKVAMMLRLCNIILRQPRVESVLEDGTDSQQEPYLETTFELYNDVCTLFNQIDSLFSGKLTNEGGEDQIFALCVYHCGLFAAYLCKYPSVCQDSSIVAKGPKMLNKIYTIIDEKMDIWPQAAGWRIELTNIQPCLTGPRDEEAQVHEDMQPSVTHMVAVSEVSSVNSTRSAPTVQFDRSMTSHSPPAPISQVSTAPIGEMAPSRHFAGHNSNPVTAQAALRNPHEGSPTPLPPLPTYPTIQTSGPPSLPPTGFHHSLTLLSQGPRQTLNTPSFYFENQADGPRVLDHTYSHHPVPSTAPGYDVGFGETHSAMPGSQGDHLYSRHADVAVSRTSSFESDGSVQLVRSQEWIPHQPCGPWMDGYVGT